MSFQIPIEHLGVILKEEFVDAFGLTLLAVSKGSGISVTNLRNIIKGKIRVSEIDALKLSKFFNVSESFFINIQTRYNLDLAKEAAKDSLSKIVPVKIPKQNRSNFLET